MLAYDPAANGAEWVFMRGTTSNLSPAEDMLAQELSNIMIQDLPEDAWRVDCLGKHQEGCNVEAPAKAFCTGDALHEEEEAMEQVPPDREEVGSESSEESEESEEESEGSEGGHEEPAEKPTRELVEKLTKKPIEEPVVECPTLAQESLPKCSQEGEEEVVVHVLEDKIHHLC